MSDVWNKFVQILGFESCCNSEQYLWGCWNILKVVSMEFVLLQGWCINDLEFFNNKDFDICYYEVGLEVMLIFFWVFWAILLYEFCQDDDQLLDGNVFVQWYSFEVEVWYN